MLTTFFRCGKTTRINSRIFGNDGKAVMVAVNHCLGLKSVEGIENMERTLGQIMEGVMDSLTIHKGMPCTIPICSPGRTALVLKCTNATRYRSPEETAIATRGGGRHSGSGCHSGGPDTLQQRGRFGKLNGPLLLLRRRDSMASRPFTQLSKRLLT